MTRAGRVATLSAVVGMLLALAVPAATASATPVRAAVAGGDCTADTRVSGPVPALSELQSEAAWATTRGDGVTVAVVDSGVGANPHLDGAVLDGVNLVPDGADAAGRSDAYGHGTAIAGQIAARRIAGSGVEGLAPAARILPVRVFAGTSDEQVAAGWGPSTARMSEGIRYAADRGAQIISVAMSTRDADAGLADAVSYATARGSLVVASAGNRDQTLSVERDAAAGARYPAGFAEALGVSASDGTGVVTDASVSGAHVDVAAPGQLVPTTSAAGGDCVYAPDAPATSYAVGYAAAAAALVAAARPDESPAQWAYRLMATAVRADPDRRDDAAGWGVVQPADAMTLIPGSGIRGPQSPFAGADALDPPPAPAAAAVTVSDAPGPDAAAIGIGVTIGIGALVTVAVLGALGVASARRGEEGVRRPARTGRGLYGDGDG